jgi:hypothetical protein
MEPLPVAAQILQVRFRGNRIVGALQELRVVLAQLEPFVPQFTECQADIPVHPSIVAKQGPQNWLTRTRPAP